MLVAVTRATRVEVMNFDGPVDAKANIKVEGGGEGEELKLENTVGQSSSALGISIPLFVLIRY